MPEKTNSETPDFFLAGVRREAGRILSRDANRLKLIEAIMICATPVLLYMLIGTVFQAVLLPMTDRYSNPAGYALCMLALRAVLLPLTLLFTLPLFTGLLYMARRMVTEEEVSLPDVFHAFSGGKAYRMAVRISYPFLWRMWLFLEAEAAIDALFRMLARGDQGIRYLSVPVMVAVGILWAFLCMQTFGHSARLMRGQSGRRAKFPHAGWAGWWYWSGFFPWLLLSFLTVGILLLADVLPRMLVAYCYLGEKLVDQVIGKKEDRNE